MIGRRLANGLHAVPVLKATPLPSSGIWARFWRLELQCGHVLERHVSYQGARAPAHAGCPEDCAGAIGEIRRALRQKETELVAEELRRWAKRRKGAKR